jgi:hypothetical protein
MFRLNDDFVVDATITGGLARYVVIIHTILDVNLIFKIKKVILFLRIIHVSRIA